MILCDIVLYILYFILHYIQYSAIYSAIQYNPLYTPLPEEKHIVVSYYQLAVINIFENKC